MKIASVAVSLLSAAGAVNAAAADQCPMDWDNPADEYGNKGYVGLDFYFEGRGQLHFHSGCTYWRQNYPRNITRDSVGCMAEDGRVVPIGRNGRKCATFHYIPNTDDLPDHQVQIFRTVKKDFVCGWNFTEETGKWHCAKERKQSEFWTAQWVDAPAPTKRNPYYYFPAGYQPGVISSELWTWWMKYPPNSTTGPVELEYRIPDNPYSNQTFLPGDGTYPVVMEFILESP